MMVCQVSFRENRMHKAPPPTSPLSRASADNSCLLRLLSRLYTRCWTDQSIKCHVYSVCPIPEIREAVLPLPQGAGRAAHEKGKRRVAPRTGVEGDILVLFTSPPAQSALDGFNGSRDQKCEGQRRRFFGKDATANSIHHVRTCHGLINRPFTGHRCASSMSLTTVDASGLPNQSQIRIVMDR